MRGILLASVLLLGASSAQGATLGGGWGGWGGLSSWGGWGGWSSSSRSNARDVTPHVFHGDITLRDIGREGLDYNHYDGSKGFVAASGTSASRTTGGDAGLPGDTRGTFAAAAGQSRAANWDWGKESNDHVATPLRSPLEPLTPGARPGGPVTGAPGAPGTPPSPGGSPAPIPLPAAAWMLLAGLAGLGGLKLRRRA